MNWRITSSEPREVEIRINGETKIVKSEVNNVN
ncbi:MAG: hypothetical protein WCP55_10995 [Lentisphaerota bacterium]